MVFVKIYTRWKRTAFAFLAMERRLCPYEISLDQSYSKREPFNQHLPDTNAITKAL